MGKSLVIVESPAKTKTLRGFLGPGFVVEASMGHVRDLPQRDFGVDVDDGFRPKYVAIPTKRAVLKKLQEAAERADAVYLASDPDREGEAIAWHLARALKLKDPRRIEFNEITRSAVEHAIAHPRTIDDRRVSAQEARRVLDRLVGYRLSPLLCRKVRKNLSAGRVQSVAVRLVCDREREIVAFTPEEYWTLTARLTPQPPEAHFAFDARFVGRGKEKMPLPNQEAAQRVLADLEGAAWAVKGVKQQERKRGPAPPFITSTLQQEASRKLSFGNRRTMGVAQRLYEGVELGDQGSVGLITYMRTDSTRVASEAQADARRFIEEQYGPEYVPPSPPRYRSKGSAQDAHEAIRPTSVSRTPDLVAPFLKPEELRLYRLIWQRFVASQMQAARFNVTTVDIEAAGYLFRATGSVTLFDGFRRVYTEGRDTEDVQDEDRVPLPSLRPEQMLDLLGLLPEQHFTEPPPRYTEATLVKALEEKGIGRPSTYASIIATVQERGYVELREKRFHPTDLGFTVTDLLVKHFPVVMDVSFTAGLETLLDEVEEGEADRVQVLTDFYGPFDRAVNEAQGAMEQVKPQGVVTEHACPNCGKPMVLRQSDRGPFLGCSGYPRCKTILNVDAEGNPLPPEERQGPRVTDQPCPKCGKPLVEREGRLGKFLGCSGYPRCKTIVEIPGQERPAGAAARETDIACPMDGGRLVEKKTRYGPLMVCSNAPSCAFKSWLRLDDRKCPQCGWPVGEQVFRGRASGTLKCSNPDCSYTEKAVTPVVDAAPSGT